MSQDIGLGGYSVFACYALLHKPVIGTRLFTTGYVLVIHGFSTIRNWYDTNPTIQQLLMCQLNNYWHENQYKATHCLLLVSTVLPCLLFLLGTTTVCTTIKAVRYNLCMYNILCKITPLWLPLYSLNETETTKWWNWCKRFIDTTVILYTFSHKLQQGWNIFIFFFQIGWNYEIVFSFFLFYYMQGRVVKCVELIQDLALMMVGGSSSFSSLPQSPVGVLEAAATCLKYKRYYERTVGTCPNSPHTTPLAKRGKLDTTITLSSSQGNSTSSSHQNWAFKVHTTSPIHLVDWGLLCGFSNVPLEREFFFFCYKNE